MENKLFFYPNYSGGNPYQKLLYHNLVKEGWEVKAASISQLVKENESNYSNVIFHIHWLNSILSEAKSQDAAWAATNKFVREASYFKQMGGRVIWTVHNHAPHENNFPEQDLRLRHFLSIISDRVHLHCGSHLEELEYLRIDPSKVHIHRHGSYIGYYGLFDLTKRIDEFNPQKPRALFLGMIREYKNISNLITIAKQLRGSEIEVTIAGKCESTLIQKEIELLSENYGVKTVLRRLTEAEVHELCIQHEIGIISYDRILTSGTLKLYLSYGMHIIAPTHKTILLENRHATFSTYCPNNPSIESLLKLNQSDYRNSFITSYFLAQESRWSTSLFDF